MSSKSPKFLFKFLKKNLWWLDVLYPLALGLSIFAALSYVVYSGPRQSRLSLRLEKQLMESSLAKASGRPAVNADMVRIITPLWRLTDEELVSADKLIDFYAESIEHLSAAKIPLVIIHWQAEVRGSYDQVFDRLQKVVAAATGTTKLFFVASSHQIEQIPIMLRETTTWLNDSPCDELKETQIDCSYVPEYEGWVIQRIFENANPSLADSAVGSGWLSDQLANGFTGYILNLSPPNGIARQRMSKLGSINALPNKLRVAIVSAEIERQSVGVKSSDHSGANVKLNGVRTVYDRSIDDGAESPHSTPLHVFWAMIAQMLVDESMVQIPPATAVVTWTALLCVALGAVMVFGHALRAILVFCLFAIFAPTLNAMNVRYFGFYWPLFDSLYFGVFALMSAGLVRLSWITIQRWRLEAQMNLHAHVTDIKSNFVSLLSHNLNTPVAKMQGMLDVLRKSARNMPDASNINEAEALTAQLELTIRSVLIAAALEEGVLSETARRPDYIMAELLGIASRTLRRLGITVSMRPIVASDESLILLPLSFDMRALNGALLSLAALFYRRHVVGEVVVAAKLSQDEKGVVFAWEFRSNELFPSKEVLEQLTDVSPKQIRKVGGSDFFAEVMAVFVNLVIGCYDGTIAAKAEGEGGAIKLTVRPR
jgi:signal transduction histidine kinase